MPDLGPKFKKQIKQWIDSLRAFFIVNKHTQQADHLAMKQVLKARDSKSIPSLSQIKHFPKLLNGKERKIAIVAIISVIITGGFLAGKLINSTRTERPAVGGSYTEGMIGSPQLINPLYSLSNDVDNDLTHLIYSGLMRYDSERGLITDLADSYEVDEDGLTYTFYLKENAKWHDGKPVLADDVIFTITAIQNIEYRSPLEISFRGITAEQIDERTIQFKLSEPFAPFLSLLTTGILPSHLWQNINPLNAPTASFNLKPVGSGPYKFEKFVKDSTGNIRTFSLKRNEKYYNQTAFINELTFKFYSDLVGAVEALRNHNIEGIAYLPIQSLPDFENSKNLNIITPDMQQYVALFFNQDRNAVLKNYNIREALALATNKTELVETALYGHGNEIDSFILNGSLGYSNDIEKIKYNLELAISTLEDADWILTENTTIRQKNEENLVIELVTINATELVETAKQIKEQWELAGVEVVIKIVNGAEFQNDILKNRNYDILLAGEIYGIDPDPYSFWHSTQTDFPGLNLAQYSVRTADELIETARSTIDIEERTSAYQDLQIEILSELPAIFLYQPKYIYAISDKINNVHLSKVVIPSNRFSTITDWYIKTRKSFSSKLTD